MQSVAVGSQWKSAQLFRSAVRPTILPANIFLTSQKKVLVPLIWDTHIIFLCPVTLLLWHAWRVNRSYLVFNKDATSRTVCQPKYHSTIRTRIMKFCLIKGWWISFSSKHMCLTTWWRKGFMKLSPKTTYLNMFMRIWFEHSHSQNLNTKQWAFQYSELDFISYYNEYNLW